MNERKIIFRCRVGSHLYGLNTPESDEDFLSVFVPTTEDLLGLNRVDILNASTKSSKEKRRNTKDDIDDISYSLPKFLNLLIGNNPNVTEVLFADEKNILICEPEFRELMNNHSKIVSQKIYHSFTGYAFSQRKKLVTKRVRYTSLVDSLQKMLDEFTEEQLFSRKYAMTEENSNWLNDNLEFYKNRDGNTNSFHKEMPLHVTYEMLKAERDNYGWRVATDSFETLGYDKKFGMHTIRIIAEGLMLIETGKLVYPFSGEHKANVMRIRNGEMDLEELLAMHDTYAKRCEEALKTTALPKTPNFKYMNNYLVKTLKRSIIA